MNEILNIVTYNRIIFYGVAILGLIFSLWVYIAKKDSKTNQFFALTAFSWIIGEMTPYYIFRNFTFSLYILSFLPKIEIAFIFIFFIFFYFFVIHFIGDSKKFSVLNVVITVIGIIGAALTLGTNFFQYGITVTASGMGGDLILTLLGKLLWLGYAALITLFILYLLFRNYYVTDTKNRQKIQYFLVGMTFWTLINIVFNVILPLWKNTFEYAAIGNYSIIFLFAFTSYAIIQRKLFDIKIVLVDVLVGVLAFLLLINWVISSTLVIFYVNGIILVFFGISGWLLIRNVNNEIKSREQLQALAKQLEADNEKLKKLDEMKTDFVSMTAHQLRTPLTVIKGYLSMVLEGDYGAVQAEQQKDILAKTMDSSDKLIGLVNDILDVTHLEGEGINYDFKKTNITDIVKDAAEGLQEKAQAKKLFITVTDPNFQGMVFADADKLRQVFVNLIDNAIKYTKIGGVTILLRREITQGVSYVVVGIQDTGLGFRPEDQNILFTKFGRTSDAIHSSIEGSGLGLYIVKKIVTDHHGEIWAESAGVNQGATFWVRMREA